MADNPIKKIIKKTLQKLLILKLRISLAIKINKIQKNVKKSLLRYNKTNGYSYRQRWQGLSWYISTKWHEVYTNISDVDDVDYVSEDIYYTVIEPKLNDMEMALAYADKNFYERYSKFRVFPEVLLRNIHGNFYDSEYNRISSDISRYFGKEESVIAKPTIDSGGGINVEQFTKNKDGILINNNKCILNKEYLYKKFRENYMIQKYIKQHEYYKQFNLSSLNTVRVFTYRSIKTDDIVVLHAVLRMGQPGSIVDNASAGGICCKIDNQGCLNKYAVDKNGNKYYSFSDNHRKFCEAGKLYRFEDMKDIAVALAKDFYYFRVLGFDICVNNRDEIKIIEINNRYAEINFFQMAGDSLFGKYTDEIIEFCK